MTAVGEGLMTILAPAGYEVHLVVTAGLEIDKRGGVRHHEDATGKMGLR
jgi:hypothetical protein